MARFVAHRFAGLLLTLWAAATLTFVGGRLVPGDPVAAALSDTNVSPDVLALRREALGLDRPLYVQYGRYLAGLLRGDMGVSWYGGEPVTLAIAQQFPATLALATSAMSLAVVFGLSLGIVSATRHERVLGIVSNTLAGLSLSTPLIISGPLLIYVFAIQLDWLPATGQQNLASLVLPALALGLSGSGAIARITSASLREVQTFSFVLVAHAKGLSARRVLNRHTLPVALMPILTVIALQFGFLLGGAVVTESLFARPGLGGLLVDAVLRKDLPIVQGVVLLSALVYSLLSFTTDVVHAWLDPRIALETSNA